MNKAAIQSGIANNSGSKSQAPGSDPVIVLIIISAATQTAKSPNPIRSKDNVTVPAPFQSFTLTTRS